MAIPKAVALQGERAEELRKKIYEEGKTPQELNVKSQDLEGEAPLTNETPPEQPEEVPKETSQEDYKKKYDEALHQISLLKGKLNSEVPDLVAINKEMAGQIATLQATVSELQAKLNRPDSIPEKEDPQEIEDQKIYEENYPEIKRGQLATMKRWVRSDDFRDVIKKIVLEVVSEKIEPRFSSVEKEIKTTKEESLYSRLDRLVRDEHGKPCWKEINEDPEFMTWLKSEKYGGHTKLELLRMALSKGDMESVADFFLEYQRIKKSDSGRNKKTNEEDLSVAPARSGSTQPFRSPGIAEAKPKTFTRSFVKQFHTDVALGRYKNRPKERERIAREIDEAMAKGLIINE